jgi:beta-galactosidase/beta-glucuronidase
MRTELLAGLCATLLLAPAPGARAQGTLRTRWADQVSADHPLPEYPRPTLVRREWLSLNGPWEWQPAKAGEQPARGVPLTQRILVPFAPESALSGLGGMEHHAAECWYRRTFRVPREWGSARRIILNFGAVDWRARVFVNGQMLGVHEGGYLPFALDITDVLAPGGEDGSVPLAGEQELLIQVEDPTDAGPQPRGKQVNTPGGIFYTPTTGIWQTVWLEPVGEQRLARPRITATLDGAVTALFPPGMLAEGATVEVTAMDGEREVTGAQRTGAAMDEPAAVNLAIADPRPWTPDSPALYTLRMRLKDAAGATLDEAETYFAIRTVTVEKDAAGIPRLRLNGEPVFCLGLLDQGFWPDGLYTAPTDEALRSDIEATRRLGFNTIRKHVKVEPERWYYWADRLGVLVWQDMPSGDRSIGPGDGDLVRTPESAAIYERELAGMIEHLRPHPSIIMWVPFNEGWGQYDTARITGMVKGLDPSRVVNSASGWADRATGDVRDIHSYPGPDAPPSDGLRVLALGEFGGLGLRVEGHSWDQKAWGYKGMKDAAELARGYTELLGRVRELKEKAGLSAAIYTQTTDVETECNGLMTYDRARVKPDENAVRAANAAVLGGK